MTTTTGVPTPPPLREGDKANFATLLRAANNGDLAIVSAIRKSDNKAVALVCAMGWDNDTKQFLPAPLAVMIEGNPFDDFFDPTVQ